MPTVTSGRVTPVSGAVYYDTAPSGATGPAVAAGSVPPVFTVSGANYGGGLGIFANVSQTGSSAMLGFNTLLGGDGISLSASGGVIVISVNALTEGFLPVNGTAAYATRLAGSQTISVIGDTSGAVSFSGYGTATLTTTLAQVAQPGTYSQVVVDATGRVLSGTLQPTINLATATIAYALQLAKAQTLALAGDASGLVSFVGGTTSFLTATLASRGTPGTYTQVTTDSAGRVIAGTYYAPNAFLSGATAGYAQQLAQPQTITVTGDTSGSVSFTGASTATLTTRLASVGTAGTYTQVVTDPTGRVVAGTLTSTSISTATAGYAVQFVQPQTIVMSGDATGYVSFTGTSTATLLANLVNVGTAGTYTQVTTDSAGRVIAGQSAPAGTLAGLSDTAIASPVDGDRLRYSIATGRWINGREPYIVSAFAPSTLGSAQTILFHKLAQTITLPGNLGLTNAGEASGCESLTPAAGSAVLSLQWCTQGNDPTKGSNWVPIATMSFTPGVPTAALATTAGSAYVLLRGDRIKVVGPGPADASLAGVSVTLAADR